MKILFISGGQGPDYQCDMLLHGLRSVYGDEVVDVNRLSYLYRDDFPEGSEAKQQLYGRGFTIYGLLGKDSGVDRTDVSNKITRRFYDLVIFGSIRRCTSYLYQALDSYDSRQIIFVDGEDDQHVENRLLGRGLYFKREMAAPFRCGFPIQFAIPLEKISTASVRKTKLRAHIDPRNRATYIFNTEAAYYTDYSESLFGFTMKKAGWDCLRHYEIMANRCVPEFDQLDRCPVWTMPFLPKLELIEIMRILKMKGADFFNQEQGRVMWHDLETRITTIVKRHLTTEALARYVVETARQPNKGIGTMM